MGILLIHVPPDADHLLASYETSPSDAHGRRQGVHMTSAECTLWYCIAVTGHRSSYCRAPLCPDPSSWVFSCARRPIALSSSTFPETCSDLAYLSLEAFLQVTSPIECPHPGVRIGWLCEALRSPWKICVLD
jgi:hypothetical protein